MDFPELSPDELAEIFITGRQDPEKRPVLILGAGASIPSLPSAYNLKVDIAVNAIKRGYEGKALSEKDTEELEDAIQCIQNKCQQEHITLEVLVSLIKFRSGGALDTDAMWTALCQDCQVNEFSFIIALLIKLNCLSRILTSNFDHVLEDACEKVDASFEVVTNVQLTNDNRSESLNNDYSTTHICPFHGTTYSDGAGTLFTEPFTATATGLAKPFSKRMSTYIESSIDDVVRPVIVMGYSGNDHFDLNPLLSQMKLNESPEKRKKWFWVVHGGKAGNVSNAISKIFGIQNGTESDALYGGDTLSLLKGAFQRVKNECSKTGALVTVPSFDHQQAQSTYNERLEAWFSKNFKWMRKQADDMVLDLKHNLTAAWIVSEHYRLVQLGYDEEYSFRFAGIFDIQSSSRNVGTYPHLALAFDSLDKSTKEVEFGYILEAARIYRIEMNDANQEFKVTCDAMREFIKQGRAVIDYSPRKDSETAAISIGLSIAYDYLGLVAGRKVTKCLKKIKSLKREGDVSEDQMEEEENKLAAARKEASDNFEDCIKYASLAKETMVSSLDKLIPATTWIQVGTDNMGRFKIPGSDEAILWLTKAIEGRKALIESEIEQSKNDGETNVTTSKLVSVEMHFPPLWRRGGELVQQVLETQGFNSAPNKLFSELSTERKKLVKYGYQTSEQAYKMFQEWNSTINANFPAVYDVRVLIALAQKDVKKARRAVYACRLELSEVPDMTFSEAKLISLQSWIDNIEARIDDFVGQHGDSSFCLRCL